MTDEKTTALATATEQETKPARPDLKIGDSGVELADLDQLARFAKMVHRSGMAPKAMDTVEKIAVAVVMGAEIGIAPMASVRNIAVINGRPSLWGDMMLALCQGTGELEDIVETHDANGATCEVKRKGRSTVNHKFTVDDAKKAGLWGKGGPWSQYPERMMQMRARSFALRDAFADVLQGVYERQEAIDASGGVIVAEVKETTLCDVVEGLDDE